MRTFDRSDTGDGYWANSRPSSLKRRRFESFHSADILTIESAAQNRVPSNFGAKVDPTRPFNQKQIWAIRFFLDREKRTRDQAIFDLAIESKLRGCDLVALKIGDLVNGLNLRKRAAITQRKTGRSVQFEIASYAKDSLFIISASI